MEIIRRHPEDNMLYFICGKCRTEFKETKSNVIFREKKGSETKHS